MKNLELLAPLYYKLYPNGHFELKNMMSNTIANKGPHVAGEFVYLIGSESIGVIRNSDRSDEFYCGKKHLNQLKIKWEDGVESVSFDENSTLYNVIKYDGNPQTLLVLKLKYANYTMG